MNKLKLICISGIVFISFISLFAENSFEAKKIRAIEIQGLKNVKQKVIKNVLQVDTGDKFDQKIVDSDIALVYKLGLFSDVAADVTDFQDGVKITFIVQEKLIVKKIDFKGNKEFSSRKLKEEISSKEKEGYDIRKIKDDIDKIITLYKDKGYADVRVEDFSTTDESAGFAFVTFTISEGNKILIGDVSIEGVTGFKVKKIKKSGLLADK